MLSDTMNIYALEGHKVKCHTFNAGRDSDKLLAEKFLKVGNVYEVYYTEVHSSITYVHLKNFPDIPFNSVFFQDVKNQPKKMDRKHPQYYFYNS